MDFMTRLYSLREEKDMKQKDLAAMLNIKPSAISKYEKGIAQPSIPTLIRIAEIFEVTVDYLLGLSSVKNPYSPDRFTPKEAEIIAKYRKLTRENRIRIDERIGAIIDGQKYTDHN
jgi:transcriptional regulator with XRE-family HTH domain